MLRWLEWEVGPITLPENELEFARWVWKGKEAIRNGVVILEASKWLLYQSVKYKGRQSWTGLCAAG